MPRIRVGAVVALAFAAGLIVWLLVRGGDSPTKPAQTAAVETSVARPPAEASVARLRGVAEAVGHPIFWLGPKSGYTYELTQTRDGAIYIRYLPPGVDIGSDEPYLTVATYPFPQALAAIRRIARGNEAGVIRLRGGGLAVVDGRYPRSIHLAYPQSDFQIEVFGSSPAQVRRLVASQKIVPIA
jgi:hypothetical protein